ncbi:MAG: glycosyltransferase family 39 protein [Myxacorys chilensis ATA2-1-KO14]|nr:glycosyltransferase family 39 protein [Myxacorys chilensis ATA2-1-KO14]
MLCAIFFIPFKEDFLITFPNLVAWLILGLSIYLISTKFGATRVSSLTSTSLVLTLPILIENVNTIHIDLPLASFFIAGFYFAILYIKKRQISYLALLAIAVGMLTGIKTSGLIYSSVLLSILAFLLAQSFIKERRLNLANRLPKSSIVLVSLSAICLLCLGGFWYLRNYLELGNPLGYIEVKVGSATLSPGNVKIDKVRETTLANLFNVTNLANWKTLGGQIRAKLGLSFLFLALQIILFLWLFLRSRIQEKAKIRVFAGLFLLLLVTGFLYWTTPYSADNGGANGQITVWIGQGLRYAFPCLSTLGILAAVSASSISPHLKPKGFKYEQILAISVIASTVSLFNLQIVVLLIANLLLIKFFKVSKFYRFANNFLKSRIFTAIAVLVFLVSFSLSTHELREINRVKTYGEAANYIETIKPDEMIGYTSTYAGYIFYGKHWDKQAVSVTPEEISYDQWLTILKQKKIDILSVGPKLKTMQAEETEWLKKPGAPFIQVLGQNPDREAVLYRLK